MIFLVLIISNQEPGILITLNLTHLAPDTHDFMLQGRQLWQRKAVSLNVFFCHFDHAKMLVFLSKTTRKLRGVFLSA